MNNLKYFVQLLITLTFVSLAVFGQDKSESVVKPDTVTFSSGNLSLKGFLYTPAGKGPFPTMMYNHGSEPHPERWVLPLAKAFVGKGYVFFVPFRRGQGLSLGQGRDIRSVLDSALKSGGDEARVSTMIRLHETEQLQDQTSGLMFLKKQPKVDPTRVAVMGVSFGGIQSLLIATKPVGIRCALDFAGASMNWDKSPKVGEWMKVLAQQANVPVYFVQAENDFSIKPSKELYATMKAVNKPCEIKIYPPQGTTQMDGHAIAVAPEVWFADIFPWVDRMVSKK